LQYLNLQSVTTNAISSTAITIDGYTQAETLYFTANNTPFTSFTFNNASALTTLELYGEFTDVIVKNNTVLTSFVFYAPVVNATLSGNNVLEGVDVSSLLYLETLDVQKCNLQSLDVTKNLYLTSLVCNNNSLTTLDVSNNTSLVKFYCNDNKLPRINVTANTALQEFNIANNLLSALYIRSNTALTYLNVSNNAELSMVDVKYNTVLDKLYCNGTAIGELNIVNNTVLKKLECHSNPNLTTLTCNDAFDFTTTHISINKGLSIISTSGNVLIPSIGDLITVNLGDGIVFETSSSGHFKLVSTSQGNSLMWSTGTITTNAKDEYDGSINTDIIMSMSGWEEGYPAFKWCIDYGTDWYLPSYNELLAIFKEKDNLPTVFKTTTEQATHSSNPNVSKKGTHTVNYYYYWSSTESSSGYAICCATYSSKDSNKTQLSYSNSSTNYHSYDGSSYSCTYNYYYHYGYVSAVLAF
jgi:hypothetical protein